MRFDNPSAGSEAPHAIKRLKSLGLTTSYTHDAARLLGKSKFGGKHCHPQKESQPAW